MTSAISRRDRKSSGSSDLRAIPEESRHRWLVVNADDLGLHPAVSRFVGKAVEYGAITSVSVLANGPALADVRSMAASGELSTIGCAAHLNILRGRPVGGPAAIPSLVDQRGLFLGDYRKLLARYLVGAIRAAEVEHEWRCQIEHLLDAGVQVTHIDSERHIHAWPRLMRIACRLASEYRLRWVRRPLETGSWFPSNSRQASAKLLGYWARSHHKHDGVNWPDFVWGISNSGPRLSARVLRAYLTRHRNCHVIEAICHPGLPRSCDPAVPPEFGKLSVSRWWQFEASIVLGNEWRDCIADSGFALAHYGEIPCMEGGREAPCYGG